MTPRLAALVLWLVVVAACRAETTTKAAESAAATTSTTSSVLPSTSTSSAPTVSTADTSKPAVPHETARPTTSDTTAVASTSNTRDDRYAPAPGIYHYAVTGYTETTGVGGDRKPVPPESDDTVTVRPTDHGQEVTVTTRVDGRTTQELVATVTSTDARLIRLTYYPSATGIGYDVLPQPPPALAQLPYKPGRTWEIAWNDPAAGIAGAGTGTVTGPETLDTSNGPVAAIVITIDQTLQGAINGRLTITSWINPTDGTQLQQHLITETNDATGASRSDQTRTLTSYAP